MNKKLSDGVVAVGDGGLTLSLDAIAEVAREGLLALCVSTGLSVFDALMDREMTERVGAAKHAKTPDRDGYWHASAAGSVVLGGRTVPVTRPRGRTLDGQEIRLESYQMMADRDLLEGVVMERMLARVATRRHAAVAEPVGAGVGDRSLSRSAVSRRFVAATQRALGELMDRDLAELDVAVLLLDGIVFAQTACVVALAVTSDGAKVPVGLVHGDTENKVVVTELLAGLVARNLRYEAGILVVIDGAKALAAAVSAVFGDRALIQRCTLHKRRNVKGYLPKGQQPGVDSRLAAAFANPNVDKGRRAALKIAADLQKSYPDAAASIREGLDEMFTVRGLGVSGTLARTLTTTNMIESMISVARDTSGNVKNWRDGEMVKRWCAAGILNAEAHFRRVRGHRQLNGLLTAIRRRIARHTKTTYTATQAA